MSDLIVEDDDTPGRGVTDPSIMASRQGACAVVSALVRKLGGRVILTAQDLQEIQGTSLHESTLEKNTGAPDGEQLVFWIAIAPSAAAGVMQ